MTPDELATLYNLLWDFFQKEEVGKAWQTSVQIVLRGVFAALRSKVPQD